MTWRADIVSTAPQHDASHCRSLEIGAAIDFAQGGAVHIPLVYKGGSDNSCIAATGGFDELCDILFPLRLAAGASSLSTPEHRGCQCLRLLRPVRADCLADAGCRCGKRANHRAVLAQTAGRTALPAFRPGSLSPTS